MSVKKLLVIIPDRLSSLIEKGEITERYYNPGNLFDEVHILMTNDDVPNIKSLEKTVGRATLFLHNLTEPPKFFKKTLGFRPWLMRAWARKAVQLAAEINPSLIRCHGVQLNVYLASKIKRKLKIPYVVSLHINPDENIRKSAIDLKSKIIAHSFKTIEKIGLKNADLVMPVYEPIVPYLKKMAVKKYKVCYNVVNNNIAPKKQYMLNQPPHVVCIGRLFKDKNPIHIIKALEIFPDLRLTIVGQGELKPSLEEYVVSVNLANRLHFIDSMNNDMLCELLPSYDILAIHSEYYEFSKVMIEASLAGLPMLINYRKDSKQVPELGHQNCLFVENSVLGYRTGLQKLLNSEQLRSELGGRARRFVEENCLPEICEERYKAIYQGYIK